VLEKIDFFISRFFSGKMIVKRRNINLQSGVLCTNLRTKVVLKFRIWKSKINVIKQVAF
jgi:hypothetical protein